MHLDLTTALIVFPWAFFGGLELGRWLAGRGNAAAVPKIDAARTPWMPQGGFISDPNLMRHFEIRMDDGQVGPDSPESQAEDIASDDSGQAEQ